MRKKAFTLMEILIVLVFIGFLSSLMLSVVNNNNTKTIMLAKKSYTTLTKIISELISDPEYYPPKASDQDSKAGFKDTSQVTLKDTGSRTGCNDGDDCQSTKKYKFPNLITNKLSSNSDQEKKVAFISSNKNTTSKFVYSPALDGTIWMIEMTEFTSGVATIYIDTNPKNKEKDSCTWDPCTCREPDVFEYRITYDGKVQPVGKYFKALIQSSSTNMSKFDSENPCKK